MRRSILLTLAIVLITTAPAWAELKIGVVNIDAIIAKSEPGQQAKAQLEKQFEKMKTDMEQQQKEIQSLQQEMQKQSLVLSQDAKQDKQIEFKRKVRDFQDARQIYTRKLQSEENELLQPIFETVVEVIEQYGQENDYSFIMDSKNSGLVYAKEDTDLTNEITVKLNQAWRKKQ